MFIKVFVPNANGKIELTVQELESLLKDAASKAVHEKCANCNRGYSYGGINYLSTTATNTQDNAIACHSSYTADEITKSLAISNKTELTHGE